MAGNREAELMGAVGWCRYTDIEEAEAWTLFYLSIGSNCSVLFK
jgi:hypothetical protein